MATIAGIISTQPGFPVEKWIHEMMNSMNTWGPDKSEILVSGPAAFGAHQLRTRNFEPSANPLRIGTHVFCYNARFDPPDNQPLPQTSEEEEELIRSSLQKSLTDVASLRGDFALSSWDEQDQSLRLVRDHFGKRPLYYTHTSDFFAFAGEMKALLLLPGVSAEPDEQWIADSISTVKSEKWRTPYIAVRRLIPASLLRWEKGEFTIEPYWDLKADPKLEKLSEEEAVKIFRNKLLQAVGRTIRNGISTGSELSGGLDSSGVTSMAWSMLKDQGIPFYAFSHAFSDQNLGKYFPFKDEREFSQALIQHTGIKDHIFCTAEGYGIVDALLKTQEIQSGPTQQGYDIFADSLYEEARKRNVSILLSGFGGDEGITSKAGGYRQELIQKKDWVRLKKEVIRTKGSRLKRIWSLIKYLWMRYLPGVFFAMRGKWKGDWRKPKLRGLAFSREFGERMKIKERYFSRVGFPDDPDVRARQYKRLTHDHVSQRFEYSWLAALYRKMEYAYPFWDVDLVDFYYSLPSEFKQKNKVNRYLYRVAMKGYLPDKIRNRNDKTGATVPTVQHRFIKDYYPIKKLIHESEKQGIKYFEHTHLRLMQERIRYRSFIDKIPSHPGAFINALKILLWLKSSQEIKRRMQ